MDLLIGLVTIILLFYATPFILKVLFKLSLALWILLPVFFLIFVLLILFIFG